MSNFGLIRGMSSSRGSRGRGGRGRGRATGGHTSASGQVSASFGKTLQFITSIKLQELEKQRAAFAAHSAVLDEAAALKDDLPARVELLLKAVRSWRGSGAIDYNTVLGGKLDLATLDLWLLQARKDPGFSPEVIRAWADILETHIRHTLTRFDFAKLFGSLCNEWLSSGDSVTSKATSLDVDAAASTPVTPDEFVEVGRKEMHEQQDRLKSLIFQPKTIDVGAYKQYLAELFANGPAPEILENMREGMVEFGEDLRQRTITAEDMQWLVKSLLASDQMSEDKRQTLREFGQNSVVLAEVATVLTMRLASLEDWRWPTQGVQVDMRRHLNGKYRAFTDPDVLDALLLHYIGVMWSVKLKQDILDVYGSKAWKQSTPPLTRAQNDIRGSFFNERSSTETIHAHRQTLRKEHFLAGQLATSVDSISSYDEDGNMDPKTMPASHIKQELLHFVATECYLDQALHGSFTVVSTDFEWFGPSLPYDTIIACLEFFGVPQVWLDFFRTFLQVPLTFKDDKPGELPRARQCGTPISYSLSSFFGEAVLFVLDYAVNQHGLFLHRIHDDLWFWDWDSTKCVEAWKEVQRYSSLAGLTLNATKTGAACVGQTLAPELPVGDIRWGFLKFDATLARFIIDQTEVDVHIAELRRQLAATKSVFGWINAFNKYMAFFSRGFEPRPTKSFGTALCLGQSHVDDMIDTLARIQRELFPSATDAGAVGYLRSVIAERFGVEDLPDGYFYFPIASGGLELRNPLVELIAVRDVFGADPTHEFTEQMQKDHEEYFELKDMWNEKRNPSKPLDHNAPFPSFEEYALYRETGLRGWKLRYERLMQTARPAALNIPVALHSPRMHEMDFYDKWVLSLYGAQILHKFGNLEPVDATLIPVGLVHLFRGSRHQWDQ
ncbi:hypothetical protein MKEN_00053000 [Mycena kentingensis (nom. inval.)]|nr:hypothetical protein MKEN_00053000 [Mycena kentingensis (nom. inval.)]